MGISAGDSPRIERLGLRSVIRSAPREDLRRLLDAGGEPHRSDELAKVLGISERFVAYMLKDAVRSGWAAKLADGRYQNQMGRCGELADLFQFVLACEANWSLGDRLGL